MPKGEIKKAKSKTKKIKRKVCASTCKECKEDASCAKGLNCTDTTCHKHSFFHKIIHKHVHHIHKNGHKLLHIAKKIHHHIGHTGELAVMAFIFIANLFSAGFSANTGTILLTDHTIIAQNLVTAENKGTPGFNDSKIISMRTMDSSINNSFFPGYCTYGAARISPEFFPFIDPTTQQRTWGGNAIDRCENAQATGFTIGSTPREGALLVYDAGSAGGVFGHVGKVMYYNASKKSLIIREMNRIGKFTMDDRWEESNDNKIKCFIYPKTTVTPNNIISPVISTSPVQTGSNTNSTTLITPNTGTTNQIPTNPIINTDDNNAHGSPTITTDNQQTPPTSTPETNIPAVIEQELPATNISNVEETMETIQLNFDSISDLAQHFLTQRNMEAKLISKTPLTVGDSATLTLTIKDKNTQAGYEGLLDLPFELITSNNNLETNYSLVQLIKEGRIDIIITAKDKGETSLLINFDGDKIGKINFTIN